MTMKRVDSKVLCQALTPEEKRKLRTNFRIRSIIAIVGLVAPFLVALLQTFFPDVPKVILGGWAPMAILATLALGIITIAVVYRCPFCRTVPTGIWDMEPSSVMSVK